MNEDKEKGESSKERNDKLLERKETETKLQRRLKERKKK